MATTKTRTKNFQSKSAKPKSSTSISDRAELSASTPIPFEGGIGYSYVDTVEYLPFLEGKDDYAQLLLESRLLSNTHNACIVTKKDYCAGSTFKYEDDTEIPKNVKEWFKSMNLHGEAVIEINKQMFESFFTFGNTPIELVKFSVGKTKKLFIYVHNFLEWRLCRPDDDGVVTHAVHSKLFSKRNSVIQPEDFKKLKKLPIYNPAKSDKENWVSEKGTDRTLIWYKNRVAGFNYYGLPSSVAGLIYEILEYKGARFNLDNLDNNMVVSALLLLKGNLSQTETDKIGKRAIATHTGDGKRGRVMVLASEEGLEGSDLHNLETHKEGSYTESDNLWTQKIILANQWDAVLAGILSSSTLGKGSGFLSKILEIKQNTVIRPAQLDLETKVWSTIFSVANKWLDFDIDIEKIKIKNAIDISALTDVDISPAVKVDEVREAKGLTKIGGEKGEKFLGEIGADQKRGVYVKDPGKSDPNV